MRIIMTAVCLASAFALMTHRCIGSVLLETPGFSSDDRYLYVMKNGVNLHKSPGAKTGIIARADSGEICRFEYEIGEWILVGFFDGRKGFIHAGMIAPYMHTAGAEEVFYQLPEGEKADDAGWSAQRTAPEETSSSALWKLVVFLSFSLNLVLAAGFIKRWFDRRRCANGYDSLRELAKIEESKETLKRELFLAMRHNQRLEEQVSRLKDEIENRK